MGRTQIYVAAPGFHTCLLYTSKLFKHLGEHKVTVLLIILLLIGQAYCDLALPSYTCLLYTSMPDGTVSSIWRQLLE